MFPSAEPQVTCSTRRARWVCGSRDQIYAPLEVRYRYPGTEISRTESRAPTIKECLCLRWMCKKSPHPLEGERRTRWAFTLHLAPSSALRPSLWELWPAGSFLRAEADWSFPQAFPFAAVATKGRANGECSAGLPHQYRLQLAKHRPRMLANFNKHRWGCRCPFFFSLLSLSFARNTIHNDGCPAEVPLILYLEAPPQE